MMRPFAYLADKCAGAWSQVELRCISLKMVHSVTETAEKISPRRKTFVPLRCKTRGKMPEWSIGTVSKTVVPLRVPRVRIPVFPQKKQPSRLLFLHPERRDENPGGFVTAQRFAQQRLPVFPQKPGAFARHKYRCNCLSLEKVDS